MESKLHCKTVKVVGLFILDRSAPKHSFKPLFPLPNGTILDIGDCGLIKLYRFIRQSSALYFLLNATIFKFNKFSIVFVPISSKYVFLLLSNIFVLLIKAIPP